MGPSKSEKVGVWPQVFCQSYCISKQYLELGWPDGGLQAGDHSGEWEGELSSSSDSHRSFAPWVGSSIWPSTWRLDPDISSARSLDLVAIGTKLVAVNWNSRYGHSLWAQRPWQEIIQNTWSGTTTSWSHCLGLHLCATNGALSQMWGCLQPGKKVVTYLQEPPSLAN